MVSFPFGAVLLDEQRPVTGNLGFVLINPVTQAPYSMRQPSMKLMLKRLCEKAGVTPFGSHAIRHYFAVSLVKSQKADITDIQQLLGHQRPTTTDIYLCRVAPNLDRLAGVIEGAVQSVTAPGVRLRQKGRLGCASGKGRVTLWQHALSAFVGTLAVSIDGR
ncbi:site-specific integrase [Desulfovibrio desulfuricans]|uniref:site-specific integrase n=1 Tax=Desulfovibrio desulfuricans TaxID=876 RepID=UPI001C00D338|nr:tyrosine-type recombinase/integrase [Desulfovibrio desulfuricans]